LTGRRGGFNGLADNAGAGLGDAALAWPAPAKINLFLRIVGRRSDGYHLLQTAFQFLSVGDDVHIALRMDGRINALHCLPGVNPQDDLCVRAACLLQREGSVRCGVDLRLEKHLPMGGGLGGGSSDAATVLVALNELWGLRWSTEDLARLGLQLGADVPVFLHGQAAWGEGVGDILTPIDPTPCWYLVVVPPVQVSTPTVFADPDLTRDSPRIKILDLLAAGTGNDCEAVVRRRYPEVGSVLDWLGRFASARLTGTGACCYAAFAGEEAARSVCGQLPEAWVGIVARGLNSSPLCVRIEHERNWGVAKW